MPDPNVTPINHIIGGGWSSDKGATANAEVSQSGIATIPFLLNAENIYYTLDGGWRKVGGTSRLNSTAFVVDTIITGAFTVLIGNQPAAQATSTTTPCTLPGCVPGGPGTVVLGSFTVLVGGMPAARVNDMTAHASCVAPIPSPVGKILPPGCPTVMIGG